MRNRSADLLHIRPTLATAQVLAHTSPDEQFQNATLRPVIKMQNDLLVAAFRNYAVKHKGQFFGLTLEGKQRYIENAIQKDIKFRNSLKGMIMGQFTLEEYELYIQNSSALNKRMMKMVIERLKDQLQLIDLPSLVP
ncbi:glyoxalase [Robiginitalea sp. M366]|uniref:glyoxalase n=1 Tax=Robiginitalea aestuariiviva TaxID=3036903 RepID=UPI00240D5976|nr:glyoxalase [Robiginitalea aestuariiviva]MDG1572948.1 glyoxalase [Robiginitalea aestuariiviva]